MPTAATPCQKLLALTPGSRLCFFITAFLVLSFPGFAPAAPSDCRSWGTYSFFRAATLEDITRCLKLGANPNERDKDGETPLFHLLRLGAPVDYISTLLKFRAYPNAWNMGRITVMHLASAISRDPEIIDVLVDKGGNPNIATDEGIRPIHLAARYNKDERILLALLKKGANPFVTDQAGWSPLATAILFNTNPEAASAFLDRYLSYYAPQDGKRVSLGKRRGLHRSRCWFAGPAEVAGIECFYMVVSEDPNRVEGRTVAFPVLRFFDPGRETTRNPVLIPGGGGPGNPVGIENRYFNLKWYHAALAAAEGRDLYVIDPRGVGMAHPRLHCTPFFGNYREVFEKAATLARQRLASAGKYSKCKRWLDRAGHDLSRYNSSVVAEDVEKLRQQLNVDKWVLFGESYAARYALTIAREFPDSVESMVLASVSFPGRGLLNHPDPIERIPFERLFSYCESVRECDREVLETRFEKLVDRLENEPIGLKGSVEFGRDGYGRGYGISQFVLTGARFVDLVQRGLGKVENFSRAEMMIGELEEGRITELIRWLPDYLDGWLGSTASEPVFMAHYCSEIYPLIDFAADERKRKKAPAYVRLLSEGITRQDEESECKLWDVPPADPVEAESVETDIPTLFLQGRLDPVTPLDVMRGELRNFSWHEVLVFDAKSHSGWHGDECAMSAAAYFMEHKSLGPAQRQCASGS